MKCWLIHWLNVTFCVLKLCLDGPEWSGSMAAPLVCYCPGGGPPTRQRDSGTGSRVAGLAFACMHVRCGQRCGATQVVPNVLDL
jgi:hypothetical protein